MGIIQGEAHGIQIRLIGREYQVIEQVGYYMLGAGITIVLLSAYARNSTAPERRWVRVTGRVLVSRVEFDLDHYYPVVQYSYCYDGIEYQGKRVRTHLVTYNFKRPAESLCARYPSGAAVEVSVNPHNPASSVLEPGGDVWLPRTWLPLAGVLILLGALFAVL